MLTIGKNFLTDLIYTYINFVIYTHIHIHIHAHTREYIHIYIYRVRKKNSISKVLRR